MIRARLRSCVSPILTVWLTLVWVLLFSQVSGVIILSGFLVAVAVQLVFPLPRLLRTWRMRPLPLMALLTHFVWDLLVAGLHVSWAILSGKKVRNGIVRVDITSTDAVHVTILSAMTSLVPGSVVVEVDRQGKCMYLHCFDLDALGGVDAIRRKSAEEEARLLRAFAPAEDTSQEGERV
ncbi:MAG: hypothetical protein CSA82_02695 [Actinobacteria bacterium]|nr:MAG: hypothetical protein CSA82_02695 [Actinomycetota bacterium]